MHTPSSLTLGSDAVASIRFDSIDLPHLHSPTIADVSFNSDPNTLSALLHPTFQYPLREFALDNCCYVPESFSTWLDPASKLEIWPQLETISVAGIETTIGLGDDVWEEATEEERDEWDTPNEGDAVWSTSSRLALDSGCAMRDVSFDVEDFEWWKG